jgi:hypothetical protein
MSADTATPHPPPPEPDIRRLPKIVKVEAAHVRYPQPKSYVAGDAVAQAEQGIAVDIYTDEEFPIRAMAPVLFVGDHPLTESERIGKHHYRFHGLGPEAQQMKQGDPLRLAWSSSAGAELKPAAKAAPSTKAARVTLPKIRGE